VQPLPPVYIHNQADIPFSNSKGLALLPGSLQLGDALLITSKNGKMGRAAWNILMIMSGADNDVDVSSVSKDTHRDR